MGLFPQHNSVLLQSMRDQLTLSPGLMLGSPFGPTLCNRLNAIFCVRPNNFPATVQTADITLTVDT